MVETTNQYFRFDPHIFPAGHWEQLPPAPSARHGSAAAAAGGNSHLQMGLVGWSVGGCLKGLVTVGGWRITFTFAPEIIDFKNGCFGLDDSKSLQ